MMAPRSVRWHMHARPFEQVIDIAGGVMAEPRKSTPVVRCVSTSCLPEGEVLVPIETPTGVVLAYREGEMSAALRDRLNATLDHMTACGLLERRE